MYLPEGVFSAGERPGAVRMLLEGHTYILRQLAPESTFEVDVLETVLHGEICCRSRITRN